VTLAFATLRNLLAPLTLMLALAAGAAEQADAVDTPLTDELADAGGVIIATSTIVVEPNKRGCVGEEDDYHLCRRVSALDPEDERDYDYGALYGFEHEWGHRYTLDINIVEMPEEYTYGDGSLYNYEVVAIVEDAQVLGEEFELPSYAFALEAGAIEGQLIDDTAVTCATQELCDAIAAIPDAPISPMVRVRFGDEQPLPLVAVQLLEGG
jgi:hypothetical protein